METGRRSTDDIWQMLADLLERYPDASASAIGSDGQFLPLPPGLPSRPSRAESAVFAIDTMLPAERASLLQAWAAARTVGIASSRTRLATGAVVTLTTFDLRDRFNCLISVMVDGEAELFASELESAPEPVPRYCRVRRSDVAEVLDVDDAAPLMLARPREELVGSRSSDHVHPDDRERAVDDWLRMIAMPDHAARWRGRYRTGDGRWLWVEVTNHNRLHDPAHGDVLSEFVDISEEMAALEEARAREELFRELTLALPVGVLQVDAGRRVVFTNRRFDEIVDGLVLATLDDVLAAATDTDRERFAAALTAVTDGGEAADLEVTIEGTRSGVTVCQVGLRPLRDRSGNPSGLIASVADITESARLRDELATRATFDDLTGCHNRASAQRELAVMLERHDLVGVVFLDLDEFKPVNDRLGHAAGDAVLATVADRLRGCVRAGDVVGRLGGDEFLVLYPGIADATVLAALSGRLTASLVEPIVVDGGVVTAHASIGTAAGQRGARVDQVLAEADAAMYAAKRDRRGPAGHTVPW